MKEIGLQALTSKKRKFDATKILAALSFVFFAVFLVLPFLTSNIHSGHDIEYHMSMIRSFNDAWKNGNFLSKINNLACQDYGYANSIFYSSIPSAIAVVFMHIFGLNITGAVGLEIVVLFSINGLVMYGFLRRLFNKNSVAWVVALMYQFTPYVLNQFYVRFSFSEIFLSLAVPLIFWGMSELLIKNNNALFILLFTIGYSLAIMCHLTMTVYLTLFVFIFLCFHIKEIFKNKKIFPLIISAALILMISACFYLPMLFNFGSSNTNSLSYTSAFLSFNGLWAFVLPWLLFSSVISIIAVVSLGKQLRFYRGENDKNAKCLFVLLNLSFIMSTCIFPWFLLPNFVGMIQYVWRIFSVNSVFIYVALAYLISKHGFKHYVVQICLIVLISACSFCGNAVSAHKDGGFWFTNTSVKMSMYENEISNQSDNYGLGSHKKLNYTPKICMPEYIFARANNNMILDSNVKVKEFANYFGLNQISFIVKSTQDSFVTINLPYDLVADCQVYQFATDISSASFEVGVESKFVRGKYCAHLVLKDFNGESKITIAYGQALKNYLIENPFEFIVESGQATAKNFLKKNASCYTVEFETAGATIELPTIFYKGYKLTYITETGKKVELTPKCNANGFIEIELTENGKLKVEFDASYVSAANIISACGLFALSVVVPACCIIQKHKKKKERTIAS